LTLVEMCEGVLVAIETSVNIAHAYDIRGEVIGETGVVALAERNDVVVKANGTFSGRVPTDWRERFAEAFDAEFRAWIAAAATGGAAGPSAWDGYVATVATATGVRAMANGAREIVALRKQPALYAS
jgi:myo-inositol 2-dehydrogenase/D-chiro-inositol 1-dehydrogenase